MFTNRCNKIFKIQAVPSKGFGSYDSVQRDRYVVSQSADQNTFRGTAGIKITLFSLFEQLKIQGNMKN